MHRHREVLTAPPCSRTRSRHAGLPATVMHQLIGGVSWAGAAGRAGGTHEGLDWHEIEAVSGGHRRYLVLTLARSCCSRGARRCRDLRRAIRHGRCRLQGSGFGFGGLSIAADGVCTLAQARRRSRRVLARRAGRIAGGREDAHVDAEPGRLVHRVRRPVDGLDVR